MDKKILNAQQQQWQDSFLEMSEMFGSDASSPAVKAAELFATENKTNILELGSGQGRDTIYFSRNGFNVHALDYSDRGLETINESARKLVFSNMITTKVHDVRNFFSMEKVEHLAKGYEIVSVNEFQEGPLPRKLFYVILRKMGCR